MRDPAMRSGRIASVAVYAASLAIYCVATHDKLGAHDANEKLQPPTTPSVRLGIERPAEITSEERR
jgi:hypothetical protein